MSRSWSNIEEPEQVKFKDIISEQILNSAKEKFDLRPSTSIHFNNKEENDEISGQMKQLNFNQESKQPNIDEKIKETDSSDSEIEDDINITVKGEWEKLDCSERYVIPHEKCKPQKTHNNLKFFGKNRATELLLKFTEFQWYQINKQRDTVSTSNQWKRYWEDKRENKIESEFNDALDPFTLDLINKLIYDQLVLEVDGILSCDSIEAIVLHAQSNLNYSKAEENFPNELALKIFKKNCYELKPRPNFYYSNGNTDWKKLNVKNSSRRTLTKLAVKEMANLQKLRSVGIRCPQPVFHTKHIVVMSFIGENKKPAKKLRNVKLDREECKRAYNEVIDAMQNMYQKLNLIHTDFFENNILWFRKHCYFIDFSQAIETTNKDAYDLLWKDCKTVTDFFKERNVPDILTQTELFQFVTGFDYNNKTFLTEQQKAIK